MSRPRPETIHDRRRDICLKPRILDETWLHPCQQLYERALERRIVGPASSIFLHALKRRLSAKAPVNFEFSMSGDRLAAITIRMMRSGAESVRPRAASAASDRGHPQRRRTISHLVWLRWSPQRRKPVAPLTLAMRSKSSGNVSGARALEHRCAGADAGARQAIRC